MERPLTQFNPSIVTAGVAVLLGIAFVFWCDSSLSIYLAARCTEPLAMIHVAFPWYFAILIAFALLCFFYAFRGDGNRLVFALLVIELSVMLLFTPFFLSGYSRHPDSISITGVSNNILEVLDGTLPPSAYAYGARYAQEYPISFILNWALMRISGMNIFSYSRLLYPALCSAVVALLLFFFFARFLGSKSGFLSTLIGLFCLPWGIEIQVGPHSAGTILALSAAAFLLTGRSSTTIGFGMLLAFACVLTYPISPLILLLLLISGYFASRLVPSSKGVPPNVKAYSIFGILLMWLIWTLCIATRVRNHVTTVLSSILTLKFSPFQRFLTVATTTTWHAFPEIDLLSKFARYSLIAVALTLFSLELASIASRNSKKKLRSIIAKIGKVRVFALLSATSCLLFSVLLALTPDVQGAGMPIKRGYEWFVFLIGMFVAPWILGTARQWRLAPKHFQKWTNIIVFAWLLTVIALYPVVAFNDAAYLGYPPSENAGLIFVSSRVPLANKTISMSSSQQLTAYLSPQVNFHPLQPLELYSASSFLGFGTTHPPDVIVFRKTMYYEVALTCDGSLCNNRYTRTLDSISKSCEFDKICSNPSFEVYAHLPNH